MTHKFFLSRSFVLTRQCQTVKGCRKRNVVLLQNPQFCSQAYIVTADTKNFPRRGRQQTELLGLWPVGALIKWREHRSDARTLHRSSCSPNPVSSMKTKTEIVAKESHPSSMNKNGIMYASAIVVDDDSEWNRLPRSPVVSVVASTHDRHWSSSSSTCCLFLTMVRNPPFYA